MDNDLREMMNWHDLRCLNDYSNFHFCLSVQLEFQQGLDYLRSFQPDSDELFAKKLRFSPGDDAAKLPTAIANFGEVIYYFLIIFEIILFSALRFITTICKSIFTPRTAIFTETFSNGT